MLYFMYNVTCDVLCVCDIIRLMHFVEIKNVAGSCIAIAIVHVSSVHIK